MTTCREDRHHLSPRPCLSVGPVHLDGSGVLNCRRRCDLQRWVQLRRRLRPQARRLNKRHLADRRLQPAGGGRLGLL